MKIKTIIGILAIIVAIFYVLLEYGLLNFLEDYWETAKKANWQIPLILLMMMLAVLAIITPTEPSCDDGCAACRSRDG